jgi:hypothetical protein
MPATKIQDQAEVKRWIEQGKTYKWMSDEYRKRYHLEVAPSTFANFRLRHQLDRRIVRDESLMPWAVQREHRWATAAIMLRAEGRRRAGKELTPKVAHDLLVWKRSLDEANAVVEYTPETGFIYVSRRDTDEDLIRQPAAHIPRGRHNVEV